MQKSTGLTLVLVILQPASLGIPGIRPDEVGIFKCIKGKLRDINL